MTRGRIDHGSSDLDSIEPENVRFVPCARRAFSERCDVVGDVLQFIPAQQSNTGSIDASVLWRWAASHNLLRNTTVQTMQFGIAISSTSGVQKQYSLNAYSAWWSNTSGGGSSI